MYWHKTGSRPQTKHCTFVFCFSCTWPSGWSLVHSFVVWIVSVEQFWKPQKQSEANEERRVTFPNLSFLSLPSAVWGAQQGAWRTVHVKQLDLDPRPPPPPARSLMTGESFSWGTWTSLLCSWRLCFTLQTGTFFFFFFLIHSCYFPTWVSDASAYLQHRQILWT